MPWINADFYSAVDQEGLQKNLTEILRQVGDLPPQKRLLRRSPEFSDYFELLDVSGGQSFGGAARIRQMGLPSRFNLKTIKRQDLGFGPEEGLEEVAYFLYDEELMTLVLQRHNLFRSTSWERIVNELSDADFRREPKMRKDQWSRFKRLQRIGSIEISLYGPGHHPDFSDVQPSLGNLLDDSGSQVNAVRVDLKMSMARSRKQSLNVEWVRKVVSLLRKEQNLETLKVSGAAAAAEKSETIDFMRDRLAFSNTSADMRVLVLWPARTRLMLRRQAA